MSEVARLQGEFDFARLEAKAERDALAVVAGLEALEDARRAAVRRERDSTKKGLACADYDRGVADGLRQAIAIIERGKW